MVTKLDRLARSAHDRYRIISQLDERVVGLRLSEIIRRVCHELGHGVLAAEAIGLALNLHIDGAVGLYFFAGCEAHCAQFPELVGHSSPLDGRLVLSSDDYPLEYYEDGYPKLPDCLDRRSKPN
jgi:hypothetical protein